MPTIPRSAPRAPSTFMTPERVSELTTRGLQDRQITKDVAEFFGLKVAYGEDGNISAHYYPYLNPSGGVSYKERRVASKQFQWIGQAGELFGYDKFQSGGKRLIITEGELDAMSVAQAYKDKYDKIYPVVSLTSATGTAGLLKHRDWVRSFDEVCIWMDNDGPGQEALETCLKIVGVDKAKIIKSPPGEKDASDVLLHKGWKDVLQSIWDAASWCPAGIITKDALWEALVNYNSIPSVPYPACLSGLNMKVKGMRLGEIALFISGTGCFAKGTPILLANGQLANVEDITTGMQVMGSDGQTRNVLSLFRGSEMMVRITLRDGTTFVCNESHVLSLVSNDSEGRWDLQKNEIVDVTVKDYLKWSDKRKHLSKAFKVGMLPLQSQNLPIDPYILGVWLGDGTSAAAHFTCQDSDTIIMTELQNRGLFVYKSEVDMRWNSPGGFRQQLKDNNLFDNKHIPEIYLISDIDQRLQLLAGLLDTDGTYDLSKNTFEFSRKSLSFILTVKRLCESLGFATTLGKQKNNKFGNCYRLWISGDGLELIPTILPRKQARLRLQKKDPHRYSFTIEHLGIDDFYGFEVDKDSRFVLGNFVVTHNSGKSTMLREIMLHILECSEVPITDKIGVISLEEAPAETARKLSGMAIKRNPAIEEINIDELKVGFDAVFGTDRMILLDHQGSIADGSIVDQLEYMILMGCRYLFIDHITILVSEGSDGLTGNEAIDKVMNDLLRLVKRHPVWIGLVSHLRKAPVGKQAFEEGKLPSLDDIRGSGSIKQVSFDILAFARNMTSDDAHERNTIKMAVLKSRYTGLTGGVPGAFYVLNTGRLVGVDDAPTEEFTKIE